MPRLSDAKQRVIRDGLEADMEPEEIAEVAQCGISTVYRLRLNLELFGALYLPSCMPIGRPRTFTCEEEEVRDV